LIHAGTFTLRQRPGNFTDPETEEQFHFVSAPGGRPIRQSIRAVFHGETTLSAERKRTLTRRIEEILRFSGHTGLKPADAVFLQDACSYIASDDTGITSETHERLQSYLSEAGSLRSQEQDPIWEPFRV
jgi:hypothetical protein